MHIINIHQVQDIRNQMFHSGNFEMTNDDVTKCLHKLQEMIVRTAPLKDDTKIVFDKIKQVKKVLYI